MGAVSGAHLNPAVTLAFSLRGDFPWRRVPGYIVVQFAGASLACLFLWAVFGKVGSLGATEPGRGGTDWKAFLVALVLTVGRGRVADRCGSARGRARPLSRAA
jgi:aquaporin Z